ncbi:MAG: hypothetical protein NKF39_00095 [Tropheryma whipplei]|uniref:hypothetical protein n=1 Tax=Tropheryma whipplei TaxID=2039 RepID=UPI0002EC5645|nr:hypothetical protein [Tropheryma whipplei]MCO8182321.1 hypothetical protein [Tropheryma whipplei]
MRLKISVFCLLFAGIFLLASAVLQQLFFVELFGYKKDHFSTSSGYILLRENELFEQPDMSVQVSITPRGNPEPFEKSAGIYTAYSSEIQEWLKHYSYSVFDFAANTLSLGGSGKDPMSFLARNRDFFISQELPDKNGRIRLNPPRGVSVLLQIPGPAMVEVVRITPMAGLFMWLPLIVGLLLITLGLIVYVWSKFKSKRNPYGRRSTYISGYTKRRPLRHFFTFITCLPLVAGTSIACGSDKDNISSLELLREMHAHKIAKRVVETLHVADSRLSDPQSAMAGTALRLRQAAYKVLRKNKNAKVDLPAFDTAASVRLILPENTKSWPRVLLLVIDSSDGPSGEKLPPLAVLLRQNNPLDNYLIEYLARLTPNIVLPKLPTAEDGSILVRPESKLLAVQPSDIIAKYRAMLNTAGSSKLFDQSADILASQIRSSRSAKQKSLAGNSIIIFRDRQSGQIGMTTANGGALVFVDMLELERVIPSGGYSIVPQSGGEVSLLSGIVSSLRGIETTYSSQLLFYIPTVGSNERIALLGFTRGIASAREVR